MINVCSPKIFKGFRLLPHQLNSITASAKNPAIYRWLWWNWSFEATQKVERVYYENGQLKSETPLDHQEQTHGVSRGYYKDGKPEFAFPHCQGRRHGVVRYWHNNGRLLDKVYYLHGIRVCKEKYQEAQ